MTPLAEGQEQLPPEQLLSVLQDPLLKLAKEHVDADVDPEKIQQFLKARKAYYYYDGKQNLAYHFFGDAIDYMPVGSPVHSANQDEEEGFYDYIMNIVKGDGRKFAAVIGNRAPNVKAVADDDSDEEALTNQRKADATARLLYSWWRMKRVQRQVAYLLWKAGTIFGYTPFVSSEYKYGKRTEPKFRLEQQQISEAGFRCPQCGQLVPEQQGYQNMACPCGAPLDYANFEDAKFAPAPVEDGFEEYPNGRVECHLFSVLYVTVPFYSRTLEDVPWLKLEYEEHKGRLMAAYPGLREYLEGSDSNTGASGPSQSGDLGVQVRQAISSPTGAVYHRKNLVTYTRYWLRPEMFQLVKEDDIRNLLVQNYPEGVKITRVKDKILKLEGERIDHVWAVCKPETSDFVYADPMAQDHIEIQDVVNVILNIGVETFERAIPWMMGDPEVIDFEQIRSRARRPAEMVPIIPGQGQSLKDAIREAPMAQMSAEAIPFSQMAHEGAREIAGVTKTVFGGDSGQETTAREYEGKRNQAMMQLSTPWDEIRDFVAQLLKNGVRQLARFGPQVVKAPGGGGMEEISELASLEQDNWHYEVEETIPITPGQRADRVLFLLEKGPTAAGLLGLLHPQNAQLIQDLLGMTGLYVPNSEEIEAVKEKIRALLKEAPIQNPQTGILESSLQPEWAENSELWVAAIKAWAISKAGRKVAKDNPKGWSNVIAYGELHEQKLQQMQLAAQVQQAAGGAEPSLMASKKFEPMPPQPAEPALSPA